MENSAHNGKALLVTLPILIFLSLFAACGTAPNANSGNNSGNGNAAPVAGLPARPSDDPEELAKYIKLPVQPEEVMWFVETDAKNKLNIRNNTSGANARNANAASPPDNDSRRLVAVLKFAEGEAAKLTELAAARGPGAPAAFVPEDWFPAELIAESETSGDQSLKGTQFNAADFFQPPYVTGKLIKTDQAGYFVLELLTF